MCIDGHGQSFRAIVQAFLSLGNEAPHLAAGEVPSLHSGLSPSLALAEGVTVAFIVIGGNAGGEEVAFHIAGQLGALQLAFSQHGNTRLASGGKEFGEMALRSAGQVHAVERGVNVRGQRAIAVYGFCRQEATGRDGDPLEVQSYRALVGRLNTFLCFLQAEGCRRGILLQVVHVGLKFRDCLLLLDSLTGRCISLTGGLRGGALALVQTLLQLLDGLVTALQLLTELLNLLLLGFDRLL